MSYKDDIYTSFLHTKMNLAVDSVSKEPRLQVIRNEIAQGRCTIKQFFACAELAHFSDLLDVQMRDLLPKEKP